MELLKEYRQLEQDFKEKTKELEDIRSRKNYLANKLQSYIISKKIYLSLEDILKYFDSYPESDIEMRCIIQYSKDGYLRIVNYSTFLKFLKNSSSIVGGYNVEINGKLQEETSIDYLWEKRNV